MKKLLLVILSAMFVSSGFAGEFDKKGVISGWKFVPVQVGAGLFDSTNLFDADSAALFSFGFAGVQQHSSIISLGGVTELKNNYGIQLSAMSITDRNYGLMIGLENGTIKDENSGLMAGLFNITGKFRCVQFFGVNCFDLLHIGLANLNAPLQIGILNVCDGGYNNRNISWQIGVFNAARDHDSSFTFQCGLLNYNPDALIPWMPLFNFSWH